MQITKNHLYNILVGELYEFQIFEVVDAAQQKYYIGSPVGRGGTKVADTIEELRNKLEMQVEPLNRFSGVIAECSKQIDSIDVDIEESNEYDIEKYNELDDRYFYYTESISKNRNSKKAKKTSKRVRNNGHRNHPRQNGWMMPPSRCH